MPVTFVPLNQGLSRRNASGLLSMTETVWLRSWRLRASVDPTRPQPMITTCTRQTLHRVGGPPDEDRPPLWSSLPLVGGGDVSKRILLGRKLRTTQMGAPLLPKRIALPVFASDALSWVAYAPDEIFIM